MTLVIGTEEALLGGVPPQFVVDVSAAGASYRGATVASSIDELTAAFRAAAMYRSSTAWLVIGAVANAHHLRHREPCMCDQALNGIAL